VDNKEFWTQDFQRGKEQKEYQEKYYEEILHVIKKYHDYSILGHLDMIKRYDKHGEYPFEKVKPLIQEILKTVIHDGKGIEVNTSCFRYGINDLTPSLDILKLYKSLGGEIITIGSDSHEEGHLGCRIYEVHGILKELGFQAVYTFDKMEPIANPF
jgi:histidinol-phosphatase (PHP family)